MIKLLPKSILAILVLCLLTTNLVKAQSVSNEGMEFWSVFPTHLPNRSTELANISVFITGRQASSGTVSVGSYAQKFNVVANTVTEIQVPRNAAYISNAEGGRVLSNRAIHIVVDAGQPAVVVYSHIFAGARSAASLILPVKALGQQYYSMNYTQALTPITGGLNYIAIVASEPSTKVFIRRGAADLVPGGVMLNNVGDVFEYLFESDLTGVSVSVDSATSGCKRFAMFSGSSGTAIGNPSCTPMSYDPLYQQNYPIESWGRNYGFIPFSMKAPNSTVANERTLGNYIRVVAKDDNTTVRINGNVAATLNSGGFYSSPSPLSEPASITADKPISVAQYSLTSGCGDRTGPGSLGDPDMVILNPIEYSIKNITVYSSTRENISEQYINVLIKTASASSFMVNGRPPTTAFTPVANLPGYSYIQLNVNGYRTNNFNLTADDGFNAIAYGFGNVESYAYSAGTNLATTLTATAVDPVSNLSITSACVYDEYFLQLTLNVPTQKIVWTINPSNTVITSINPVVRDTIINNQPYYVYKIPKQDIFKTAGIYQVKIVADLPPSTGGCKLGDQDFNFPFTVYSAPVTAFTMPASVCAGTPVSFADKSTDNGKKITSWIWKFGDGTTSTLQNPVHTYTLPGIDTVSLTAVSESGCQTTTQQYIQVNNLPVAAFTSTNSVFKDFAVLMKDASTIIKGNIVKWTWSFGDGKTEDHLNPNVFEHIYPAAGTYPVTLTVTSDQGCQNVITQNVIAKPGYKPNFQSPEICINDLAAQFLDLTADTIGAAIPLTYLWNFGDAGATATNPNTATEKNPVHSFTKAQIYQITLTVTANDGSSASITKPLQVNGSSPKAAFNILTPNLCSNVPVIFENQATVDVGNITKIEWYFDFQNQPTVKITDENPLPGKRYVQQYAIFNTPASKTFTVRMVAYSGITCMDITEKTITISANPKVVFTALGSICLEEPAFQLTQATDVSGAVDGKGVYSGAGVTAAGFFDPVAAGVGSRPIKYVFTNANGCADSLTRTITVNATPVLDAGKRIFVRIGNSVTLSPKTSGKILSYLWTPAIGLSNPRIANPIVTPTDDITYRLTVTSTDSCTATDTVALRILKIPIIPNTFTPNNDGVNDVWNIQNLDRYPDCVMEIFNRYGMKMFHSVGYATAWDGRFNGQEVPVGTYYYVLNLKDGTKNYGGYVTVIR
jgi:gliding motility-associated-like protein